MRMPKSPALAAPLLALALSLACSGDGAGPGDADLDLAWDFSADRQGWEPGFVDYPVGQESFYELAGDVRPLPPPLAGRAGFLLSGNNHSDDLFMYLRRRVTGLEPGASYRVAFHVELATNAPAGCIGVGGAPGEGVRLKVGAATEEPTAVVEPASGWYRLSVDKANQGEEGSAVLELGDVAGTNRDCTAPRYEMKTFDSGARALDVPASAAGEIWLFVGTESGFEATTSLYYTRIAASLTRR